MLHIVKDGVLNILNSEIFYIWYFLLLNYNNLPITISFITLNCTLGFCATTVLKIFLDNKEVLNKK